MNENRITRVKRLHNAETQQWGFHARDRNRLWIFKIDRPIQHKCHVQDHEFDSEWISLTKNGMVTIHASKNRPYAWDGCTPKFTIGNKQFILGTPDGYKDIYMELPITGKASLIHDAFYQYLHVIPVPKIEIDKIFRDILKDEGFALWPIYYIAVRLFGGWFVKQEGLEGLYYDKYRPIYLGKRIN